MEVETKNMQSKEPPERIEPYEAKLGACTDSQLTGLLVTGQQVAVDGSIVLAPTLQLMIVVYSQ